MNLRYVQIRTKKRVSWLCVVKVYSWTPSGSSGMIFLMVSNADVELGVFGGVKMDQQFDISIEMTSLCFYSIYTSNLVAFFGG